MTTATINTNEILKEAQLDFEVFQLKTAAISDDYELDLPLMANCRLIEKNGSIVPHVLGTVSESYKVLQNKEAFSVFDPLFENGLIRIEKAGCFDLGKRVFIQARVNTEEMEVVPGDVITPYILLAHSFDGSLAVHFGFADERVTCKNSLSRICANKSGKNKLLSFRHKGDVLLNLEKARDMMSVANQQFITTVEAYREMAKVQLDQEAFRNYVKAVFSTKKADEQLAADDEERKSRVIEDLERAFENSPGNDLPGVRGSLWAALNSVTYFSRHERGNKNTTDDKRLESVWFGSGAQINNKALDSALALL